MATQAARNSRLLRIVETVGSLKFAFWILVLLMLLVFAGTWEQQNMSLLDVQTKFFESFATIWWVGGSFPVPLAGGFLLLSLLFVNLLIGGVVRLRKRQATVGILIAHLGILSLLAGTAVEHLFSEKGSMRLYESQQGNEFRSDDTWEVAVSYPAPNGKENEFIIPQGDFDGLDGGDSGRFSAPGLPFDLVLSQYTRNAQPRPAMPLDRDPIQGFILTPLPPVGQGQTVNVPGLVARVDPKDGSPPQSAILWGMQYQPWALLVGGKRAYVDLRRRTWELPFALRLEKFQHVNYPGTDEPKEFSSYVTRIEGGSTDPNIHITMNEPLRYKGYTFYQSGWGPQNAPPGSRLFSVFSVVSNPTDRWPMYMMFVIAFGLLFHFLQRLFRFLAREAKKSAALKAAGTVLVLLVFFAGTARADDAKPAPTPPPGGAWSDAVHDVVAIIPVQDEGRVKPLNTWAGFALLKLNHRRSCKDARGKTLDHLDWFLDTVFRPDWARHHVCFLIQTSEILDAIGLSDAIKKKRDRYSYDELATPSARERLNTLARRYHQIKAKERTRVQGDIVELESNMQLFEGALELGKFARHAYEPKNAAVRAIFGGREHVDFLDVLEKGPELHRLASRSAGSDGKPDADAQAAQSFLVDALGDVQYALPLGLLPPTVPVSQAAKWLSLRDVALRVLRGESIRPAHLKALGAFAAMARSADDPARFLEAARSYQRDVRQLAEGRGEYSKIQKEVFLYQFDPLGKALVLYLILFGLLAVTWLRPRWRWLEITTWALLWGTLGLHVFGIVLRCIIRGRPPVSTLYETVIFVSAVGVLALLAMEHMVRRRVALALAPIVGALGLFIASRYEVLNGTDTMPQLRAVLDTNFWLMTHVTCISIGYTAGIVAGLIAHVYVLGKAFFGRRLSDDLYRTLGKMVYGTVCFALLFSLIGTILGGIWANESWGRFWGWDPKEDGALLICLTQLAILHGRLSGILKTFGICMAAIFGGCIVAFSWWGVNLLGIGLHSYGFTSGIFNALMTFYGIEGAVLLTGFWAMARDRGFFSHTAGKPG
jgi:ABC-type transport system involved in cytochrome c biogenesis permease subunit